jgi:hypothetical protein
MVIWIKELHCIRKVELMIAGKPSIFTSEIITWHACSTPQNNNVCLPADFFYHSSLKFSFWLELFKKISKHVAVYYIVECFCVTHD